MKKLILKITFEGGYRDEIDKSFIISPQMFNLLVLPWKSRPNDLMRYITEDQLDRSLFNLQTLILANFLQEHFDIEDYYIEDQDVDNNETIFYLYVKNE